MKRVRTLLDTIRTIVNNNSTLNIPNESRIKSSAVFGDTQVVVKLLTLTTGERRRLFPKERKITRATLRRCTFRQFMVFFSAVIRLNMRRSKHPLRRLRW